MMTNSHLTVYLFNSQYVDNDASSLMQTYDSNQAEFDPSGVCTDL